MYVAAIDYDNLDNPLFLKMFAEAVKQFEVHKAIIVHGDSAYTERLIQTGMMREDAQIRSIQDLNHRLISFFADYGLACIGINGFQRGTIKRRADQSLKVNADFLNQLPDGTIAVVSNLIEGADGKSKDVIGLPELIEALNNTLKVSSNYVFSTESADQLIINAQKSATDYVFFNEISESEYSDKIPAEFKSYAIEFKLSKPLHNNKLNTFSEIAEIRMRK
ncbi:MAG: hypothetical protein LAT57_08880 [Balneolales bacterium]|nr:hypothetical protein [Balneolales bacterium]